MTTTTTTSFEMMAERSSEDSVDNGTEVARMLQSYSVPCSTTRDWRLFNVVLLGVTFLFVFTAFQTCSMVEVCDGALVYVVKLTGRTTRPNPKS